jgi:Ca2+-binding RTX toxin-like protein
MLCSASATCTAGTVQTSSPTAAPMFGRPTRSMAADKIHGDDGDDTLAGENSELFFNSTIIGHDLLNGCGNENDYDAESGDDIIFQGAGIQRMAGFDWAIHKRESQAADYDTNVSIFTNQQINNLRDRFDLVEGLSGWKLNDKLTGRDVVSCIPDLQRWRGPGSTS